ncbi:MAG: YccF domain-containing protein [Ruminococcaceae bacterium]|nr:YccF domain-containing protein [Oscillospiraceae bacterium]
MLKFISNLIWFIFGGLILALLWFFLGLVLCITIVGIPFGIQCFKVARISLFPFGKKVKLHASKHPIANFIWFILFGLATAIVYLGLGILHCITIIGIPKGIFCFKIMKLALFPFGAEITK